MRLKGGTAARPACKYAAVWEAPGCVTGLTMMVAPTACCEPCHRESDNFDAAVIGICQAKVAGYPSWQNGGPEMQVRRVRLHMPPAVWSPSGSGQRQAHERGGQAEPAQQEDTKKTATELSRPVLRAVRPATAATLEMQHRCETDATKRTFFTGEGRSMLPALRKAPNLRSSARAASSRESQAPRCPARASRLAALLQKTQLLEESLGINSVQNLCNSVIESKEFPNIYMSYHASL